MFKFQVGMQDVMNSSFPDVELEFLPRSLEKVKGMLGGVHFILTGNSSTVESWFLSLFRWAKNSEWSENSIVGQSKANRFQASCGNKGWYLRN